MCVLTCFLHEAKYMSIFMLIDLESELGVNPRIRHGISLVVSNVLHKSDYTYM